MTALSGWSISDLTAAEGSDPWYIKASGTNNWKLAFDTSNMASDAQLSIRARAIDNEGNTRAWTDVITVTIDKNVPVIGSPSTLRLIQKDSSGTTVVSRDYTAGMYISCRDNDTLTWYLAGSCEDDSGLASLTLATPSGDYISFSASDTADTSYFKNECETVELRDSAYRAHIRDERTHLLASFSHRQQLTDA
jgi:hypothetical protein